MFVNSVGANLVNSNSFNGRYGHDKEGFSYPKCDTAKLMLGSLALGTGIATGYGHAKGLFPAKAERNLVGKVKNGLKKIHINIEKILPKAHTKTAGAALAAGHILIGLGLGAAIDAGINTYRKNNTYKYPNFR